MIKWILFFLLISASLGCENFCNYKGVCGPNDVCHCFMGWGGICPFGEAFADIPLGNVNHLDVNNINDARKNKKYKTEWTEYGINPDLSGYVTDYRFHRYAECSNAGSCDRKTGECRCYTGYEGSACERRGCPPYSSSSSSPIIPCGGHGKCISNYEKYLDYNKNNPPTYHGWEMEKFYTCVCDEGFTGYDCSLRTCPIGYSNIDSETVLSYGAEATGNDLSTILKAEFYFVAEYKNGNTYTTQTIINGNCGADKDKVDTDISENINVALKVVPGLSIESVIVTCDSGTPANYASIKIILNSKDPNIKSLTVKCDSCATPPDPKSLELKFKVANDPSLTVAGLKEAECSNKGICDTKTGECKCLDGYIGSACDRDLQAII